MALKPLLFIAYEKNEYTNNLASVSLNLTILAINDPPAFTLTEDIITLDEDFTQNSEIQIMNIIPPDDELSQSVDYSLSPSEIIFANISIKENLITIIPVKNGFGSKKIYCINMPHILLR